MVRAMDCVWCGLRGRRQYVRGCACEFVCVVTGGAHAACVAVCVWTCLHVQQCLYGAPVRVRVCARKCESLSSACVCSFSAGCAVGVDVRQGVSVAKPAYMYEASVQGKMACASVRECCCVPKMVV
jgi:hypothetical protein